MKRTADIAARDANEGDTRLVVTSVLADALGYDLEDLTTEYAAAKGQFADYGIRSDNSSWPSST